MKSNKKAILGMLVAMVMSLGVMNGINQNAEDINVQQVSAICGGISSSTEGFWSGFTASLSVTSGAIGTGGAIALLANQWHPGGWVAAGVIGGGIL